MFPLLIGTVDHKKFCNVGNCFRMRLGKGPYLLTTLGVPIGGASPPLPCSHSVLKLLLHAYAFVATFVLYN